jgi:hypothetical protein
MYSAGARPTRAAPGRHRNFESFQKEVGIPLGHDRRTTSPPSAESVDRIETATFLPQTAAPTAATAFDDFSIAHD